MMEAKLDNGRYTKTNSAPNIWRIKSDCNKRLYENKVISNSNDNIYKSFPKLYILFTNLNFLIVLFVANMHP